MPKMVNREGSFFIVFSVLFFSVANELHFFKEIIRLVIGGKCLNQRYRLLVELGVTRVPLGYFFEYVPALTSYY